MYLLQVGTVFVNQYVFRQYILFITAMFHRSTNQAIQSIRYDMLLIY